MRAVVAYRGSDDGPGALLLGAALRRTTGAELSVVAVLPRVSFGGEDRADKEYRDFLDEVAARARQDADAALAADGRTVDFERVSSTSVAAGLAQAAEDRSADVLILGCAAAATAGSVVLGSVAERLLHSSPVPVMLAPHEWNAGAGPSFTRLTCAYAGTARSREALVASCVLAERYGLDLRVATFVPRAATMYPLEVGLDAEDMVAAQWAEQVVEVHEEARELCKEHGIDDVELVVGRGRGWAGALQAVPWRDDEVLVFGSSRLGQIARVFLGSNASRILRNTPVPTLVVPCGTTSWSS